MPLYQKLTVIFLLFGVLLASPAFAHKVNIFAYVEEQTVYTECYFPDGQPVIDGKLQVFDSAEKLLLEGHSDKQGMWQFAMPKNDDLTLVVNAGMGHRGTFRLNKPETRE